MRVLYTTRWDSHKEDIGVISTMIDSAQSTLVANPTLMPHSIVPVLRTLMMIESAAVPCRVFLSQGS